MGLFETIFGKKPLSVPDNGTWKTLTAYQPAFYSYSGSLYEIDLVRSAIESRALYRSKLKVDVIGPAHPELKTRLKSRPNTYQTWSQFIRRFSTILDMQNSAFIVPTFDEYGRTRSLNVLLPSRCTVVDFRGVPYLKYTFRNGQTAAVEMSKCGLATRYQYEDDLFGATNGALRPTVDLIKLDDQGIKEAVKSSAAFRFMAKVSNFSKNEDLKKERKRFTDSNFKDEDGGILLFPNTYSEIKQIYSKPYTVDPKERELIKTNVFDYYQISEEIIQNRATTEMFSSFYEGAVETFAIQLTEILTGMIYTETEQNNGNKILVTANRLQHMSPTDKLNFVKDMGDRGFISINEGREVFNLPPIPGGDIYPVRGEYYHLDENGKETDEQEPTEEPAGDTGGNSEE